MAGNKTEAKTETKATAKAEKTLDTSRPYGEVFGQVDGVVGARYQQDNALFDSNGKLLKTLPKGTVDKDQLEENKQADEEDFVPPPAGIVPPPGAQE